MNIVVKDKNSYQHTTIDFEDVEIFNRYSWKILNSYVTAVDNGKLILFHRLIMNAGKGLVVDHISGNRLDNRKSNLRIVTSRQNSYNRNFLNNNNVTGQQGVSLLEGGMFHVQIRYGNKKVNLGYYDSLERASEVYQAFKTIRNQIAEL